MRWGCLAVAAVLLLLLLDGVAARCSCDLRNDQSCPNRCETCTAASTFCVCETGCMWSTSSPCNSGYYRTNTWGCSWGVSNYQCRRDGTYRTDKCETCKPGRYGLNCDQCPNGESNPCNSKNDPPAGSCNEGISGDGKCVCNPGFAGSRCEYSNVADCNGNGDVRNDGKCDCFPNYRGGKCNNCKGSNYYNYPTCKYCKRDDTCNGRGSCTDQGNCNCETPYEGESCEKCIADHYDYPTCRRCRPSVECNNHGTCSPTGACVCATGWAGTSCDRCASGYYGPDCLPCPGSPGPLCGGSGTCSDGLGGDGTCACMPGFRGDDCTDPSITSVDVLTGPVAGGTTIRISGNNLGTSAEVHALDVDTRESKARWGTSSISNTLIIAQTAAGVGRVRIRVTRIRDTENKVSNDGFVFVYSAPSVTSFTPASAYADTLVTIRGTNFGPAGRVLMDGVDVLVPGQWLPDLGYVVMRTPKSQGGNRQIVIQQTGGRDSPVFMWSYLPPLITSAGPPVPTDGGGATALYITIRGNGFGFETPQVSIAGNPCSPITFYNYTRLVCRAPAGRGRNAQVAVTAGGLQGTANVYSYLPPTITGVSGAACTPMDPLFASDCPTAGGTAITVDGTNFGTAVLPGQGPTVTIGGRACTSVTVLVPHTRLQCTLPSGYGLNLTLTVTRDGFSASSRSIGYASPKITPNTLRLAGQAPKFQGGRAYVDVPSVHGGIDVEFDGQYFGLSVPAVEVTYGSVEIPTAFKCNVVTLLDDKIRCTVQPGTGRELRFFVRVGGVPSELGIDVLNFPLPTITPSTLRLPDDPDAREGRAVVTSKTNLGEPVLFNGTNFGEQKFISVRFGPPARPDLHVCTVQYIGTPNTDIKCSTAPGEGVNNRFTVCVGPGSSARCVTGTDIYNYPIPPTVIAVKGCNEDSPPSNVTVGCPTDGRRNGQSVTVTIYGTLFGKSGAGVTIGGVECTSVTHVLGREENEVTCILPPGIGFYRRVVLRSGPRFSRDVALVDYAAPKILRVSGCVDSGPRLPARTPPFPLSPLSSCGSLPFC